MSTLEFTAGQRWVSDAEPDLGLGLVLEAEQRIVKLLFPATGEERAYARQGAPLSRLRLAVGDLTASEAGWELQIEELHDEGGLITYVGTRRDTGAAIRLLETRLAHDLQINQPRDRLLTNQFDSHAWFEMRHASLQHRAELEQSPLRGLLGPRIAAIPHQLYIAHEVAHRHAPRVLLADEVGLGKTIEAGLILHHQWQTERAQRALIIVPPALLSQWVLELLRRFNLNAAIFDEERCAEAESASGDNPFATEQLVLCGLDFLLSHPQRAQQIQELDWDLLVVDEAHHLGWSVAEASPEYQLIEDLAAKIPGLLLLTATPEQLGHASHFAHLRLLDPDRFSDLEHFVAEREHFVEAARDVDALLQAGRNDEVQTLLDRHGTGRVLFRNSRKQITGFAARVLHSYPLSPVPAESDAEDGDGVAADPRVDWLLSWMRSHRNKVLVICARQDTAMALEQYLHFQKGLRCAAFHEGLGLLARDRAAAWFAQDDGARALICSEIGSEGRNFQFAQHLVLFDLPGDPDLLEQRIGRLDRIGQRDTVHIHVPFVQGSGQDLLFQWYHLGLDSFARYCHAGSQLKALFADELQEAMRNPRAASTLIQRSREKRDELNQALENGRDRLLDLSSCQPAIAEPLAEQLRAPSTSLGPYLERICQCYGIELENLDEFSLSLRPDTNYEEGFKDISLDGTGFTSDRDTALAKEDLQFLSWEHPLITEAMDRVLGSHRGNTALGVISTSVVPAGTLLLECLFQIGSVAPKSLQLGRYLPPRMLRLVIDHELRSLAEALPFAALEGQVQTLPLERVKAALVAKKALLEDMLNHAQAQVEQQLAGFKHAALESIEKSVQPELARLRYLKTVNPSVRDAEIQHLEQRLEKLKSAAAKARIDLTAVRVLIAAE